MASNIVNCPQCIKRFISKDKQTICFVCDKMNHCKIHAEQWGMTTDEYYSLLSCMPYPDDDWYYNLKNDCENLNDLLGELKQMNKLKTE